MRRLAADDPTALEDAFAQYGPRCNAIAYRILGDEESARDAVQEAFLSLWRHRHGFVVRTAGIGPWICVVARNAALSILRSESARTQRQTRGKQVEDAQVSDPATEYAASVERSNLRSAVAALPDEQRQVVELAYFRFLTLSQIAQQTATPLGTVKRRAQLALRRLSSIMSEATQ